MKKLSRTLRKWLSLTLILCTAWAGGIWIRHQVFQVYTIPSPSMENTLRENQKVGVFKGYYQQSKASARICSIRQRIHKIKRNDILLFHKPGQRNETAFQELSIYVKRCVGLPGDRISMHDGTLYNHQQPVPLPTYALLRYRLDFRDSTYRNAYLHQVHTHTSCPLWPQHIRTLRNGVSLICEATESTAQQFPLLPGYRNHQLSFSTRPNRLMYPSSDTLTWNMNRWGPIYLPRKGDRMALTEQHCALYGNLITRYEHHTLTYTKEAILLDGRTASHYIFGLDYFYLMGDRRMESEDSRFFGPIPSSLLIGKVVMISPF